MRELSEQIQKKYAQLLSAYIYRTDTESQRRSKEVACRDIAEILVLNEHLIPEEVIDLSICDFHGCSNGQLSLEPDEVMRAKNLICKYCWGEDWCSLKEKFQTESEILTYLSSFTFMDKRYDNGNNVVIFGDSEDGKPIGRTLTAALILKEAIRMRLFDRTYRSQTYDWVDFSVFRHNLLDKGEGEPPYKYSDWLVIDNIVNIFGSKLSVTYLSFIQEKLNAFFMERLSLGLNTILVFDFDIRDYEDSYLQYFGIGIKKILQDKKTCKIPLTRRKR